jgi:thymidine phosphorylase
VKEALAVLRGEEVPGLSQLCRVISGLMLCSAGQSLTQDDAEEKVTKALASGLAHEQFLTWATAQGGDASMLENPQLLPLAPCREIVSADHAGWVQNVEPRAIGAAAGRVGGGRLTHGAQIDHAAGVLLRRRVGDHVAGGEALAEIHYAGGDVSPAIGLVRSAFTVGEQPPSARPVLLRVL